jgi:hypothetical protein
VTGQYFVWTSNAGGNRLDAFIVKVPSHLLVAGSGGGSGGTGGGGGGTPPDTTLPSVSITVPAAGATVSGNVTVSASASDDVGVVGVQFKRNGVNLGPEVTAAPYSLAWNTGTAADGTYTLTAVARDAAGNSQTSAARSVIVSNAGSGGGTGGGGTGGGGGGDGDGTGGGGGTGGAGPAQKVVWTSVVNAAVNPNNVLRKLGGCNGCQDSGAVSQQRISGNGYMEFTASERTTLRYVGLSPRNAGTGVASIAFAFALQPGGIAEVRERGVYRAETRFATGDVLRIAVTNGVVRYYKNGALVYQSATPSASPLLVDTALLSKAATVKKVMIGSATGSTAGTGGPTRLASVAPLPAASSR